MNYDFDHKGLDARSTEQWQRFIKHLPPGSDLLTVVLKSHLLIEEKLTELINLSVVDPTPLSGFRLSFEIKQRFAQSLVRISGAPNFWPTITALNNVRNRLGHEVEPLDLDKKLSVFFDAAEGHPGQPNRLLDRDAKTRGVEGIKYYCFVILTQIFALSEVLRIHKKNHNPVEIELPPFQPRNFSQD